MSEYRKNPFLTHSQMDVLRAVTNNPRSPIPFLCETKVIKTAYKSAIARAAELRDLGMIHGVRVSSQFGKGSAYSYETTELGAVALGLANKIAQVRKENGLTNRKAATRPSP